MTAPGKATLFAFNVGFGDCFLLRFSYPDETQRHVLIDFGSTRPPAWAGEDHMLEVAERIKKLCGGKLDILVATHRHKDHISGFATAKSGKGSGDIIASLNPKLVLQPWTEDPRVPVDAMHPLKDGRAFTSSLASMNEFAGSVQAFAQGMNEATQIAMGFSAHEREFLEFLGENNVANKSAVANLVNMGKSGKALYLHADSKVDVADLLPGVKLHVLGPPTVKQQPEVSEQAAKNAEEYWHLLKTGVEEKMAAGSALFPGYIIGSPPRYARWIKEKLGELRKDMLFSITTALDDAMNNTSLILLFQIGRKSLLFPGDAQWENWQYALSQPEYQKLLKSVDLYKVGHHGSLNATPKSLWNAFDQKDATKGKKNRLVSVMSTLGGVHGKSTATAVPRETLVKELKEFSDHHSTEDIDERKFVEPISIEL